MATRRWTAVGVFALATGLPGLGQAQIVRNVTGGAQTVRCGGQTVQLNGAGGTITLLGQCPSVQVNGTSITVRVEAAGSIEVDGMSNTVIWERAVGGSRPRIRGDGVGNSIRQGSVGAGEGGGSAAVTRGSEGEAVSAGRSPAPKARGAAVAVRDNRVTRTIACAGGSVTVDGNGNTLSLTGECPNVEVNGNGNVLRVEAAGSISVMGDRNAITWSRGIGGSSPEVSNLGTGNSVARMVE